MPTYVYEVIRKNGKPGRRFEVRQKITDPPLRKAPRTGEPVRRIIFPPYLPQFRYDRTVKKLAHEDKLKVKKREIGRNNAKKIKP